MNPLQARSTEGKPNLSDKQEVDPAYLRLAEFRREGESDAEFGKRLGVSQQAVYDWRKGNSRVSRDALEVAVEKFGTSMDYLLYGEDREAGPPRSVIAERLRELVRWLQGEAVDWHPERLDGATPAPGDDGPGGREGQEAS